MYRIHFDTSRGVWLLQFLKIGIIWCTVKSGAGKDILFDNIEEIAAYVTARGIDKVYKRIANPIERESYFLVPGNQLVTR